VATLISSVLLADCTVGPDYKRPEVTAPTTFRFEESPAEASSIADLAWWSVFNDKALQDLISEGLKNNYDLQVAVARIGQARALVAVAESEGKPQVGYQGFAQGETTIVQGTSSDSSVTFGSFGGLLSAAWEFDVWGRIRRSTEAANANVLTQEDIRRGVMLTLVSDLAAGYFRLLELDRELAIAHDSAGAYKKTLDLFTDRYQAGKDSELPVTRTQADYDSSRAEIAVLQREIAQQEDALSVLVGAPPRDIVRGRLLTEQSMPQAPAGLTTDLLRRRPDILAAEQTMVGANAQVGVAVANFYPRVGLSALAGGVGIALDGFHGFGLWNLALNAAGPIFTGGRLEGLYHERQAFWDQTVAQYRQTILVAFQETSDALVAQKTLVGRREALEGQVKSLRHSVDIAFLRYDSGRAGYFEILQAQQQLYPAEYQLAQTQQDQLLAEVNLYKALGGGWNLTPAQWSQPQ
jgi:multidrug efflux system outer membrane protein